MFKKKPDKSGDLVCEEHGVSPIIFMIAPNMRIYLHFNFKR